MHSEKHISGLVLHAAVSSSLLTRLLLCPLPLLLPVLQLLDLHGRDSYLLCDVTKAHDYLWTLPLTQGYSEDVVEGRRELLDNIKERALLQEGRVKQDSKGIDVPVQLLPSALALLAQVRAYCVHGWLRCSGAVVEYSNLCNIHASVPATCAFLSSSTGKHARLCYVSAGLHTNTTQSFWVR